MNRNYLASGIFTISVLLLTRFDFLTNHVLYGYGLIFSSGWHSEYTILYFLAYQLVVFALLGYTKNLKIFAFFQCFVLTSTQDLVYFGIWERSFPSSNWTWMFYYQVLGYWNTVSQIILSLGSLTITIFLLRVERVKAQSMKLANLCKLKFSGFLSRLTEKGR